jgi:hypothetical protein
MRKRWRFAEERRYATALLQVCCSSVAGLLQLCCSSVAVYLRSYAEAPATAAALDATLAIKALSRLCCSSVAALLQLC